MLQVFRTATELNLTHRPSPHKRDSVSRINAFTATCCVSADLWARVTTANFYRNRVPFGLDGTMPYGYRDQIHRR